MRKLLCTMLAMLMMISQGFAYAESFSVDDMTKAERDALLAEIVTRNAEDIRGSSGGTRPFSTISRSTPVVCGETARFGLTISGFDIDMTLKSVVYGSEALSIIKDANTFNAEPKDGTEYIVATFVVEAKKDGDDTVVVKADDFKFVSRNGAVYKNKPYIVGLVDEVELYDKGIDELQVAHVIDAGDVPLAQFVGAIWFDLAPSK